MVSLPRKHWNDSIPLTGVVHHPQNGNSWVEVYPGVVNSQKVEPECRWHTLLWIDKILHHGCHFVARNRVTSNCHGAVFGASGHGSLRGSDIAGHSAGRLLPLGAALFVFFCASDAREEEWKSTVKKKRGEEPPKKMEKEMMFQKLKSV